MMTSMLTMTSGRNSLQRRLTNLSACNRSISAGNSGSPLLNASDNDLDPSLKNEPHASDEDNNNNRSASDYLSKLLNSRHLSHDLDNTLGTESGNFSYVPMKSSSTPSTRSGSSQHKTTNQKKNSRTTNSNRHKPAEVFRKDLISAMKIPDNSQFLREEYWIMQDPWRIEWEKGVQVPVNQKAIPMRDVQQLSKRTTGNFRMPRKMVKSSPDADDRDMVDFNVLADSTCRYDLDDLDVRWLKLANKERKQMALKPLDELTMEKIMEELEIQCHESMQTAMKTKEGLGIEYDENVVCDVCQLRDCEEGNEMVFCDGCNLCVHQACYGIMKIPEGNWLCKPCALGIRGSAVCILCEKKDGAMKSTRSGNKWAHVSCAMWIPEIRFGDAERMEPITKVSLVPASRWTLLCSICKNRVGACIQCSIKQCVTAYHVTCAFESKLDMIAEEGDSDDDNSVVLRSYCKKHSTKRKDSDSEDEQSEEEKRSQRQRRIMELEEQFYTFVKTSTVASNLGIPRETAEQVEIHWKLKRRANFNKPLITPKNEEDTALAEAAETNLQKRLRMFTHLRQDLERVRNLCYMIGRREKTKRSSVKNMESVFLTQMKVLERRMRDEYQYDSTRMVPFLKKFGKPNICRLAQKESLILARTCEWSQSVDDSDHDRPEVPASGQEVKADAKRRNSSAKRVVAENDAIVDGSNATKVPEHAADKLKNGLHRKAFASACQKREVLLRSERRRLYSNNSTSTAKESSSVASPRKRSHRSNTDTDDNIPSLDKAAKKKSRLVKSHSQLSWRTSQASASPSSYTVKTNESLARDSDAESSSLRSRIGSRRNRSVSVASDLLSDASNAKPKLDKPVLSRTEKHLIVTWESDKNDDPDILEKSTVGDRRLSLKSDETSEKNRKSESRFTSRQSKKVLQRKSKPPSVDDKSTSDDSKSSAVRPSLRTATRAAKNASGALAPSCESTSLSNEKWLLSSEQELRRQLSRTPPSSADQSSESVRSSSKIVSRTLSLKRSSSKQEDDCGYGGDMESDSDAANTSRHRHVHHRPNATGSPKSTDTSESLSIADRYSSAAAKKRRLKMSRLRSEKRASLVSFRGFKDIDDGTTRRPSSDKSQSTHEIPSSSDLPQDNLDQLKEDEKWTESIAGAAKPEEADSLDLEEPGIDLVASSEVPLNEQPSQSLVVQNSLASLSPELHNNVSSNGTSNQTNQDYSSAYYGGVYAQNSLYEMSYMQQQALYYQSIASHFSYPLWAPPPPPPPPPPPEEEDSSLLQTSVLENSIKSELPSSEAQQQFSSSLIQPCNHVQDDLSTQVHPPLSAASQVPPQPDPSSIDRDGAPTKKKKKKKSKKKKKKRKRKHSRHGSDAYSSASSEYCIEYCSTLVGYDAPETSSPRFEGDSLSQTPPVLAIASEEQEPKGSNLATSSTAGEDSQLLLKIDKSKFLFNSEDLDKHSINSGSPSETEHSDAAEKNKNKPLVTPLKLKLCGLKSDRTLRGGLVAREYQILDSGASNDAEVPRESKSPITTPVEKPVSRASTSKTRLKKPKTSRTTNKNKSTKAGASNRSATKKPSSNNTVLQPITTSAASAAPSSIKAVLSQSSIQAAPSIVATTRPGLHPEQHWKKRKLHVHEASVTTDEKSQALPKKDQQTPAVSQLLPPSTSSTIPRTPPIKSRLFIDESSGKLSSKPPSNSTTMKSFLPPSVSASSPQQNQQRRKKANDAGKLEKSAVRSAQSSRSPASLYKFTVSNTHQRKVAAAGKADDQSAATNKDQTNNSSSFPSEGDPYDFMDFGET